MDNIVLLSKREIAKTQTNKKRHCFDIIFEWEDILSEGVGARIKCRSRREFGFDELCRKIKKCTNITFYELFRVVDFQRGKHIIMFDASTKHYDGIYYHKKYIPCLIDYFFSEEEYKDFLIAYSKNKLVLVSNLDVYEYLKEKKCPIPIEHFPLSIPDHYISEVKYKKEYDLIIAGRVNPLLEKWVEKAENEIPELVVIRRKYEDGKFIYYNSRNGEVVSEGNSREEYFSMLKRSKMAIYSTPGMDGTRKDANGWNQVTPRILEQMAAQCHILARYPMNSDVKWYGLDSIIDNINSYDEFKGKVKKYMEGEVDYIKYNKFLNTHKTSNRVEILRNILNKYGYL